MSTPPTSDVVVTRDYDFDEPTLLLRRDVFGSVSTPVGAAAEEADAASSAPGARVRGPPLLPHSATNPEHRTLVDALVHTASHSNHGITFVSNSATDFERYSELLAASRRLLAGLRVRGLRAGDVAALQLVDPRTHLRAVWACALGGFPSVTVAVAPRLVASNAVAAKLLAALAQLDGRHVLCSDELEAPLRALLPAGVAVHTASAVAAAASAADADPRLLDAAACAPGGTMLYQLTSGSTGVPKAIAETHGAIVAHIRQSAQCCGYGADDTTLNWLPFDHVVPMVTYHLADVYLGRSAVQLPTAEVIADPLLWLRTMARFRVSHSWAPNFGFKLVAAALREAARRRRPTSRASVRL